ncbi:MAG TPA: NfeD family protein [Blastocatellia bacterium]|nr:NfeD family protein [Blastocatellia bacterium]
MSNLWYIWLILGALFILAEMFTTGFVLMWFGVGALVAGLLALSGLVGLPFQIVVFLVVSIALAVASRTIFERFFPLGSSGSELKTGIDSLPGRIGVVVTSSAGPRKEGEVRVFGSIWRAFPAEGEDALSEGEQVRIDRVDGVSVYVRHVDQLPSWRAEKQLTE